MNESPIKPVGNRVVCLRMADEKQTTGGIHLPDNVAGRDENFYLVVATNEQTELVDVGDVVVFSRHVAAELEFDHTTYHIVKEPDIMARKNG